MGQNPHTNPTPADPRKEVVARVQRAAKRCRQEGFSKLSPPERKEACAEYAAAMTALHEANRYAAPR